MIIEDKNKVLYKVGNKGIVYQSLALPMGVGNLFIRKTFEAGRASSRTEIQGSGFGTFNIQYIAQYHTNLEASFKNFNKTKCAMHSNVRKNP